MRASRRIPPHGELNALTRAVQRLRAAGTTIVDLSESNPTRVGLPYPAELLQSLAAPAALTYEPDPLGLPVARQAVAGEFARRGTDVDPDHLVLSASTSEAYSWLFKLLCDPGDTVLIPQPSYPLFEFLTRLEGVATEPYHLTYHGRWDVDFDSLEQAPGRTRAVLAVSPNNPTGSFLSARDLAGLIDICARRQWALIVDEVFADYPIDAVTPVTDIAARSDVLTFTLGGASKSIGMPQVKLGWTLIGGPAAARNEALAAIEVIADTFLSVGTPVQVAAPALLREGAAIRACIHQRVRDNLVMARGLVASHPACDLLPVEGGWSVILRVPASRREEAIVLDLLEQEHILVHPGFFFDMPHEAFLVVSLLPDPETFANGFSRMIRSANS
jgi:aspartate/methionine/tyrosine aminotransferase